MDRPAGEALLAAGAAIATPLDDDTVTGIDEAFDRAGCEQDPPAVAGALDVEHAVHGTGQVDLW